MNSKIKNMNPQVSRFSAYLILICSIVLITSCILLKISLLYGFYAGLFFSMIVLLRHGYSFKALLGMSVKGIKDCRIVL